jgi:hypothetical protein
MMKKIFAVALAIALAFSLIACNSGGGEKEGTTDDTTTSASAKTLRVYCWNTEFQDRFNAYYADKMKTDFPDVEVEWVITPNENNAYQDKLDLDLKGQADAADKIDVFLIEADYALKYVNTDYTLDVVGDVGLTDEDLSQQYEYTKQIATDSNGLLKAVSWQATPGLFAYRRSIAKDVLGTDDPAEVQTQLADWDKFDAVAAKAKEKGYFMLSGYDDAYRTFSNNMSAPWVNASDEIILDANLDRWADQTKTYTDKDYNHKSSLWDDTWTSDQGPNGKVFGFFYSTWGINFTLLGNSLATPESEGGKAEVGNGIYGDWAVTQGPQSYYWGGTWICAAAGGDNLDVVADLMKTLTCDATTMKQITLDTEDYTNNIAAMDEIANSDYSSAFLGGQNHIALFAQAAPLIDMSNISAYDQGLNEELQKAMKEYFDGNVDKATALDNFYKAAIEKYPNLKKPA